MNRVEDFVPAIVISQNVVQVAVQEGIAVLDKYAYGPYTAITSRISPQHPHFHLPVWSDLRTVFTQCVTYHLNRLRQLPGGHDIVQGLYRSVGTKAAGTQLPPEEVGGVGASIVQLNEDTEDNVAKAYHFHTRRGLYGLQKPGTMLFIYPDKSHTQY